jgi:hypothetical protein
VRTLDAKLACGSDFGVTAGFVSVGFAGSTLIGGAGVSACGFGAGAFASGAVGVLSFSTFGAGREEPAFLFRETLRLSWPVEFLAGANQPNQ